MHGVQACRQTTHEDYRAPRVSDVQASSVPRPGGELSVPALPLCSLSDLATQEIC